jgi:hypothetical protein
MYAGHNPFSVVRTAVAWPPSRPGRTMKSHWPPMAGAGEARAVVPRVNRELDGQFGDYQNEIYTGGLSGVLPALPMEFQELEARARAALSLSLLSYVAGGAGDESTQRANVSAFLRWGLVPRMMAGAARRDMSVNLFGTRLPSPLFMAPVGVIGLCAQDGRGQLAHVQNLEAGIRTHPPAVPAVPETLAQLRDEFVERVLQFLGLPGTDRYRDSFVVLRTSGRGEAN